MLAVFIAMTFHHKSGFVSSLSPPPTPPVPDVYQNIFVSTHDQQQYDSKIPNLTYGFKVIDRCSVRTLTTKEKNSGKRKVFKDGQKQCSGDIEIIDALLEWNPNGLIPSKSQAKLSLKFGRFLLFNATTTSDSNNDTGPEAWIENEKPASTLRDKENSDIFMSLETLQNHIGNTRSILVPNKTVLVLLEPIPSVNRYPLTVTKYMFPPIDTICSVPVIYEDDHLAVVNKPENMTTIGSTSKTGTQTRIDDLQSILGFLLRPSQLDPTYCPRPIHRLDRRTSGLVLIAKTQMSMRKLSQAFAARTVCKTYSALVFERDPDLSSQLSGGDTAAKSTQGYEANFTASPKTTDTSTKWLVVDYPIENRESVSEIRRLTTSVPLSSSSLHADHPLRSEDVSNGHNNKCETDTNCEIFSLVQVRPKTGRTHQIRRHLSYCLGMPIVGDSKYDGGARHLRTNGMYLCCHSLKFPHPCQSVATNGEDCIRKCSDAIVEWIRDETQNLVSSYQYSSDDSDIPENKISISIPLPPKFRYWTRQAEIR
ncbi:unnamed protein product [Pseudo-nitzschia multistriata]|uniref:Pseudouridine synthase RsuA/RluA-like domain-containing protein n=1 Tax=Pseudo-nitzschia multistriata TaxID=183589 RepID=A0A448YXU3_9STRA|nr:unnamed protein product [Pseudo-nitzschia multistriata]